MSYRALNLLETEQEEVPPRELLAPLTAAAKLGELLEKRAGRAGDATTGSAAQMYAGAFATAAATNNDADSVDADEDTADAV